jgi:hypothetical protein
VKENASLQTQQREIAGEAERNAKLNFLLSSQPLKLIKKPLNFIVMWLAIKYITSIYIPEYTLETREVERNLETHTKKSDKIKVAEIKSEQKTISFSLNGFLPCSLPLRSWSFARL